jgi:hypothetical protein
MALSGDLSMDLGGDGPGYTFTLATPALLASVTPQIGPPGGMDYYIDPVTHDYVETEDGDWLLTADSRTAVFLMHELELGTSPFTPGDGTVIAAMLRNGDPLTADILRSEALRVGQLLAADGVLSGFSATVRDAAGADLVDQDGRQVVLERWVDLASGSPIDTFYMPR